MNILGVKIPQNHSDFRLVSNKALEILENPPISEEESRELLAEVARRLEISEEELIAYHKLPECTEKFRSQEKLYNMGIRMYEVLGIEKRIRR